MTPLPNPIPNPKKNEVNIFADFPSLHFVILLCIAIITSIVFSIMAISQTAQNNSASANYRKHTNWNLFADSLQSDKNLLPNNTPAHKLFDDLRAFENSSKTANPFSPKDVSEINAPSGVYSGIDSQMGCVFPPPQKNSHCSNSGPFTYGFFSMYTGIKSGANASLFYKEAKKPELGFRFTPSGIPIWMIICTIWIFTWLIMLAIYAGSGIDEWRHEVKKFTLHDTNAFWGFLLFPPAYLIIGLKDFFSSHADKKQLEKIEETKQQKLEAHPLYAQLQVGEQRLIEVKTIADLYPKDKEVQDSYKDCLAFVEELRTYPDKLSQKSSRYLAQSIRNELQDLSSVASTRLSSYDDLTKMGD